jgi:2'-5' RNA ligase
MNGIVSLLDNTTYQTVEEIWAELDRELGLRGIYITPYPHFSLHVAEQYDYTQLELLLARFAAETPTFQATTAGLGIFTGPLLPVVYITVTRSPLLTKLHQALWPLVEPVSAGINAYYHPDRWIPHITLGHGDITWENLPDVIRLLNGRNFAWTIPINNLAILADDGNNRPHRLHARYSLSHATT